MATVLRSRTVEKIDLSNGRDYRSSVEKKVLKCPRICIGGMKENRPFVTAEEVGVERVDEVDCPVIRLSLKKPRHWNWKLTTSSSSPAMVLPVVRLVDDNGNVLHDSLLTTSSEQESERKSHRRGHYRDAAVRGVSAGDVLDGDLLLETEASEVSSRDVPGNRGNKTDSSHGTRWQNRKLDSGYKSLRKPRSRGEETSRRRTASTALSDEERVRRKRRHRKIAVVGDRLLAVNGADVCFSDQDADLLRDAPDVVRLQLARRRHDVLTATSQRRVGRIDAMGANVSRHSEKGLSGRRSQSSGNLCNGNKLLARDVGRILTSCNTGPKDRHRLCGSLPNHLDGDNDLDSESNNNNGYLVPIRMNGSVPTGGGGGGVELKMAPQQEALHDQGYGSERSPEDEHLPPLPDPEPDQFWSLAQHYPFITPDACFEACLLKGNRGLGLSVTGGIDTDEQWPGLIRIKRLFPHQPAWQSGQLSAGDIILATNGVPLTGLTNYQALEVLRTTPNNVILAVCRPPSNVFSMPPPSEPPPPPRRDPALSISSSRILVPLPLVISEEPYGEFDITLTKVNRSLGFTLRKEDESVLGHYVRALVREPALSDGRIRPGDKIVAVNDMPMSPLSHEEAVAFLRQCSDEVRLRLYRDAAQTPVAALSPSEEAPPKSRPALRQEAQDMLTDLAVRKLSPGNSSGSRLSEDHSPAASPRRRRLTKTPSPDILAVIQDRLGQRYLSPSPAADSDNSREQSLSSTFVLSSSDPVDVDSARLERPKFLDLCADTATSPKHKYTFSTSEELPGEPASLPPLSSEAFSYSNPAYQSANPTATKSEEDDPDVGDKVDGDGTRGLLKWKGVMFSQTDGEDATVSNEQILSVELNRGWNSRLGFSLQNDGTHTYISAIYSDSVAFKDGRLRPNDQLITVNEEDVQDMSTTDIIDLLRKIRGTIEIRVLRKSGPNPQIS